MFVNISIISGMSFKNKPSKMLLVYAHY